MKAKRKPRVAQLKVRLPEDLRAYLEHEAAKRGVSMNADAIARLEHSRDLDLQSEVWRPGHRLFARLNVIAAEMSRAGREAAGQKRPDYSDAWLDNGTAFKAAIDAARGVLAEWEAALGEIQMPVPQERSALQKAEAAYRRLDDVAGALERLQHELDHIVTDAREAAGVPIGIMGESVRKKR